MNLNQRMEQLKGIQQNLVGEVNKIDAEIKSLNDRRSELINELLRNDGAMRQLQSLIAEELEFNKVKESTVIEQVEPAK